MLTNTAFHTSKQHGGALLYILIAIGLLGALTASLSGNNSTLNNSQNAAKIKMELRSQIEYIRNAINECVMNFPDGDPTVNDGTITDAGYIAPYPVKPNSNHFTGSTLGISPNNSTIYLRCPGNPGIDNNHTPIFGASSGKTLPPTLYELNWLYGNKTETLIGENVTGVYIRAATTKSDVSLKKALTELASEYGECEADYIEGNNSNGCITGSTCIRIWLVRPNGC
jgi:hypothetical protein